MLLDLTVTGGITKSLDNNLLNLYIGLQVANLPRGLVVLRNGEDNQQKSVSMHINDNI